MFRIIIMSIVVTIALAGCGDNTSPKTANEANIVAQVKPMAAKNEMNTQDVKKPETQAVAIQSQTMEASQAVVQALMQAEKMPAAKQIKPMQVGEKVPVAEVVKEKPTMKLVKAKKDEVAAVTVHEVKNAVDLAVVTPPKQVHVLGDAIKGKKLAKRCLSCHSLGMKDKVGPHLKGVFNRAAGQSGFKKHSAALKNANWTWDEAHLLKWLCDSKAAVKEFTGNASAKTKMPKQKMCGQKGNDIVAYLKTL